MEALKIQQIHSRNDILLGRVERQAAWRPRALAIGGGAAGGTGLTYGELNASANRLAHRLIALGVGPEMPVAILAGRRPEAVVWALAVWKAGGGYLPLDPAHPEARLLAILADAGAPLLLASPDLLKNRPGLAASVPQALCPATQATRLARESTANPSPRAASGNLAYLIFTSGSTGKPKGVEVEHRGLANLVDWHLATYALTSADRASCLAGPGFDAAVWEVWPYLAAGASLHLPPEELLLAPSRLVAWLVAERITCAFLPTPLAEAVLAEPWPERAALRILLTGGDRLHRAPRPGLPFTLYNHYGPTEGSVVTTAGVVSPAVPAPLGTGRPSIGRPIDGVVVRLPEGLPDGEAGEIRIGGRSLARGYRGRPEGTAERFVPDPAGGPGERLYRSGDLARRLPSGELDFVGRLDNQVKVRGFRIELGEIEAVLHRQPAVGAGAVLAPETADGERRLVGYVVLRPGAEVTPEELRAALARELPEPLVPAAWVLLPALPLTPNGKVDRAALGELAPPVTLGDAAAARTPIEAGLVEIFRAVLGGVAVGVADDFFALGGHSLKVVQTLSRVRDRFGVELPFRTLFDHPTVTGLAARIEAAGAGAGEAAGPIPAIPAASRDVPIPLSYGQEGLWLLERWSPGATYNTPFVLALDGDLDRGALGRAWAGLLRRHESLRTAFPAVSGRPVQRILPAATCRPLAEVDLGRLQEPAREAEAGRIAAGMGRRPIDLERGPAFSGLLLRLAPRRHHLLALFHHIVSDDWSIAVGLADLAALYQPTTLPALSRQYADFAAWQRRRLAGPRLDRLLAYWRERLAGAPQLLDLPGDRPRPRVPSFRGFRLAVPLLDALRGDLAALGRRQEASAFMTFLAAWGLFLGRLAGNQDLLVGSPVAGRGRLELEPLVGLLVNNLALRVELAGAASFPDLLDRVRESTLGALAHQELPFERLIEELQPAREPSYSPLVQVFFVLANAPRPPRELAPGLALAVREIETGTAKVDLSLYLEEREGQLWTIWEASRDLFDRTTVERLAATFRTLLAGIVAQPEIPPAELPLLADAERAAVLLTEPGLASHGRLHEPFLRQAARRPDAVALVCGHDSLTYGELAHRAERLAVRLRAEGVGPEVPVAVFLPRTPDLVVALLGVLLAGGFYVPIDPAYPPERVALLLEDSGARVVLRDGDLADLPPARLATPVPLAPENLAYLIYTSGSTGVPKAVAISHRSAAQRIAWAQKTFLFDELSGVLAGTSICFDPSIFELFAPLSAGGTVILAENALALSGLPGCDRVTLLNTVPSALAGLLDRGPLPLSVATVNLAGEPLPQPLAERVLALRSVGRLRNLYGPSEDTTYSTVSEVARGGGDRPPAIGRPLAGTRAAVRDAWLQIQPAGVPGELCLAGEGLARGYRGRPGLTAERFVPDPEGPSGSRLYRTGDRVRLQADGELGYLGRLDRQVKLRGFRIEPGEIEAALVRQPEVAEAVVAVREDRPGAVRLVAYVVPAALAAGAWPHPEELRQRLEESLPRPLVPSAVVLLERLPRTPNGKLDRAALPAPQVEGAGSYRAPRTAAEVGMAALWAEVLGVERIGVDDDFFALGGHSLLAARLAARLEEALGREVPMRLLFEHRTVERLAAALVVPPPGRTGTNTDEHERPEARVGPWRVRVRLGGAPLSSGQRRLWFLDRLRPGGTAYNMPFALDLAGPLRPAVLARAVAAVVRRHEALRSTFAEVDGAPEQRIGPPVSELPRVDLAALPPAELEREARRLTREESARPFDLGRGPLLRTRLLRFGASRNRLLWTAHHIAFDGESLGLILADLAVLYPALAAGDAAELPAPAAQIGELALAEAERRRNGGWVAGLEKAAARLAGDLAPLDLPVDRPRPAIRSERGGVLPVALPASLAPPLLALARNAGATPYMALLAGFAALLGRLAGSAAVRVGTPASLRVGRELQGMVGFAVNTLVVPADLSGAPSGQQLLDRVREAALAAQAQRDLPFELLVEALTPERDLARSPLIQASFSFAESTVPAVRLGEIEARVEEVHNGTAKYELALALAPDGSPDGGGWSGAFGYAADLFEPVTVRRWAGHLATLLAALVADPEAPVGDLPLLAAAERHQLAVEWNDTAPGAEADLVHHRFAAQAARAPDAVALLAGGMVLTYAELECRANRLAHRLRRSGVVPESRVALATGRSAGAIVGLLGVLKAGGAYLALDEGQPAARLALLLATAGVTLAVIGADFSAELPAAVLRLDLDAEREALAREPAWAPPELAMPANLAYVLFTSGSTGTPKAVAVEHRQLDAYVRGITETLSLAALPTPPDTVFAHVSTLAADLGHTVLFPSLLGGGCLHLVARETLADPAAMADLFTRSPVDVLKIVPSHLAALRAAGPPAAVLPQRLLVFGGEAADARLVAAIRQARPGLAVRNHYGPTEATVGVLTQPAERTAGGTRPGSLPLGRPLPGSRVHLLDAALHPVPLGVAGEICIAGRGLARGYLGRPDLTAERFLPDPLGEPGTRLYRTGDRARRLPGGEVEFLGRVDHQVKIRGFRVEPGEVETALAAHPAVREAVVVAAEGAGGMRLVGYLVPHAAAPDPAALRDWLLARLPEPMVPTAWGLLDTLPRNANGKIDRRALPPPAEPVERSAAARPARTLVEELIAGIWVDLLGAAPSPGDDFFAAGGHSLLAARLTSRLRQAFAVDLPLRAVFEAPTLGGLARRVEAARAAGAAPPLPPIPRRPSTGPLPLSFAQERLWFLDHFDPGSAEYNIPYRWELAPGIDPAVLGQALAEVVRRHASLRTRFPEAEGLPVAEIGDGIGPLSRVDLTGLPAAERESAADRLAAAFARRPFHLSAGPPLRAVFLAKREDSAELLLTVHHIVFDAWSLGVLLGELGTLYTTPGVLPELPVQYADFAAWQRGWLAEGVLAAQLDFWRSRLQGGPTALDLPSDRPRPASRSGRGGRLATALPAALAERLAVVARERGATPFMVLLAGFAALLSRLSGQLRLAVGTPVANRRRPETEGMIGLFVNTLVLPLDLDGAPGFAALLGQARGVTLDAHAHADLPFERLVQEIEPQRDLGRTPLFQAMLNYQTAPQAVLGQNAPQAPGTFPVRAVREVDSGTAKFDLTLGLTAGEGGLVGAFEFAADLFDAVTVGRWSEHLNVLLAAALAAPDQPLAELPLLTAGQRQQLLREWNDTDATIGGMPSAPLLHDAVAARAAAAPDGIALRFEGEHLSAGELERRGNRLARHLRQLGAGPGTRVGLCAERSPEVVVALLAILRSGAAYLPLDPDYPRDRLEWMLEDGGMAILLTQERLGALLPPLVDERVLFLDADWDLVARQNAAPLPTIAGMAGPEDLAYVLYTSGSTGKPKGVEVRHGGAARFLAAMAERPGLAAGDVLVAITTLSFDIALLELFLPLAVGARVELVSRETAADPARLAAVLDAAGATALQATPATWRMLLDHGWAGRPGLRALSGGEALPRDLAELLCARIAPGGALWNVYGPTETTVWSTVHPVSPGKRQVPVGRPIGGTAVHLLDGVEPVSIGVAGELCIGGEGLARGYRKRPDLTAERFVPDPFGPPGARLYKTGDLARHLPGGEIEPLGRRDDQVKVRGFRIELGEVEAVLQEHPAIQECAVAVREEPTGERRLAACVVARGKATPRPEGLRGHLRQKLPDYMIPALFLTLDELPRTPNRKVDRRALAIRVRQDLADEEERGAGYVPPATPVEQILVAVWAEVLRRDRVGTGDSFFDLAGDSILAIRLVARAAREGVRFTPRDLFRHPTIAALAAVATAADANPGGAAGLATGLADEAAREAERNRSPEQGFTPSDFPTAGLDQEELDELLTQLA